MDWLSCFELLSILIPFVGSTSLIDDKCERLRNSFADSASSFTACAIRYSRPIGMCENCIDSYRDVIISYKNMTQLQQNNTKCIDNFINLDRLQILETMYRNNVDLWNKAKCNECFERGDNDITPERSNETLAFNNYYNKLQTCLNRTDLNASTLCETCMGNYLTLNDYYSSISDENQRIGICMDIVDRMNITRLYWSKHCCKYRNHNEYIFLASTSVVLATIVGFYVLVQFLSVKKNPAILQQRRFAESLSQSAIMR